MPLQSIVSDTAMSKVLKLANGGHAGARQLATRETVRTFMEDYLAAVERLTSTVEG